MIYVSSLLFLVVHHKETFPQIIFVLISMKQFAEINDVLNNDFPLKAKIAQSIAV